MIGGGDGVLEDMERLIRCSKITVQLAVRILLSICYWRILLVAVLTVPSN